MEASNQASFLSDNNENNSKIYSKESYDKTRRILTLDADRLAEEHNNILRSLSNVSGTSFYESGVTTFGWTQKLSPHALSLRHEKQKEELQFRI